MAGLVMALRSIVKPARISHMESALGPRRHAPIRILDVGCGPHVTNTKRWFSVREYHGIDREMWPGFEHLYVNVDRMFFTDLERPNLEEVPNHYYDLVVLSHIIEHLSNGLEVIELLIAKLAPNGCIYIESPSHRTLNFPSATGFLNFYDDPTHKRLYFDEEIIPLLQRNNLRVLYSGYRRNWRRLILVSPLAILLNVVYHLPFRRKINSWGLWELMGVARVWMAVRRA